MDGEGAIAAAAGNKLNGSAIAWNGAATASKKMLIDKVVGTGGTTNDVANTDANPSCGPGCVATMKWYQPTSGLALEETGNFELPRFGAGDITKGWVVSTCPLNIAHDADCTNKAGTDGVLKTMYQIPKSAADADPETELGEL